jgi:alpha-glucosidase
MLSSVAGAQVLARPGWAGSGVSVEPWWQRAVFYRLDPVAFQDSNGDGRGDLAGVAQRMDYLQSLGVDAIILAPATTDTPLSPNDADFGDLARAASTHHVRVLVALGPIAGKQRPDGTSPLLAAARSWLTQGAAGFFLDTALQANLTADTVHQLHALTASFPGERILLSAAAPADNAALAQALRREVQLIASPPLASSSVAPAELRSELLAAMETAPPAASRRSATARAHQDREASALPLLIAARWSALPGSTLAALLLASRSAVLLDYGEELGLTPAADGTAPHMQWTPGNRTLPPVPPPVMPTDFSATVYKPYAPYVAPLPRDRMPLPPQLPTAFVSETPDPRTLPGFSTVAADPALAAPNGATANVLTEDAAPYSLLNLYRHLIQLHHQNASLHDGAQVFLDHDADEALVWLRRPTPGARTSATVLVACNLSDHNLHLHMDRELELLHAPHGGLRTLASSAPLPFEDTEDIVLSPGSTFVGEFSR